MITTFVTLVILVIGGFAFSSRFERVAVARL
jgi:hypothetical protein